MSGDEERRNAVLQRLRAIRDARTDTPAAFAEARDIGLTTREIADASGYTWHGVDRALRALLKRHARTAPKTTEENQS